VRLAAVSGAILPVELRSSHSQAKEGAAGGYATRGACLRRLLLDKRKVTQGRRWANNYFGVIYDGAPALRRAGQALAGAGKEFLRNTTERYPGFSGFLEVRTAGLVRGMVEGQSVGRSTALCL